MRVLLRVRGDVYRAQKEERIWLLLFCPWWRSRESGEGDIDVGIVVETVDIVEDEAEARVNAIFHMMAVVRVRKVGRRGQFCICMWL